MKRPRKPAQGTPLLRPELRDLATRTVEGSYEGFITDTIEEDPKRFGARMAAARDENKQ
ncbi:hypothetical protein J4558_12675 [Leptolyngbya sp. 15MV]|nr:hypothetical protein J4558_12675 [Leptolyngbya sp. 15MV]